MNWRVSQKSQVKIKPTINHHESSDPVMEEGRGKPRKPPQQPPNNADT